MYDIREVDRQVEALPADLARIGEETGRAAQRIIGSLRPVTRFLAVGSGDSLHAARCAVGAFGRAGAVLEPMTGTAVAGGARGALHDDRDDLHYEPTCLIAVSASGTNPTVAAAVDAARRLGVPTIAVVGRECALAAAADEAMILPCPGAAPSPGIRTFQASLLGLLHLAGAHAVRRPGRRSSGHFPGLDDVETVVAAVRRSIDLATGAARDIAPRLTESPVAMIVAGVGWMGAAHHLAAKLCETAGHQAVALELEEWWHVHRFGHPIAHPVLFLLLPGRDLEAATELAHRTAARSPVFAVCAERDGDTRREAEACVPVDLNAPAVAHPLIVTAVAGPLAAAAARALGRSPFARR